MKRLLTALAASVTLGAAAFAQAEPKIAFVDLQRALNESAAGKAARERFVKEMETLQSNLRREKETLEKSREDFDKKAMLLREKERLNMEQELEDKSLAFKRKYEDYQKQLKRQDSAFTGSILRDLEGVIREVGQQEGYTVVFEAQSSGLLYADPATDLTEEIVRRYNAGGQKKE
jgi:outer membrane protein